MSKKNPKIKVKEWLDRAQKEVSGNWNAMCLSTVDKDNYPDSRMVLFKQFSNEDNIIFFTNYTSKKGKDIENNEAVSAVFFWDSLDLQLRVRGTVKLTSREVSKKYFNSRPFESRVAAILSDQSNVINSYDELHDQYEKLNSELAEKDLSCPEHWGGVEIIPFRIEFWHGHKNRLHRREVYELLNGEWEECLLSP
ncbi:MAG: pyridoxamine 5'-phosphate oxidase [Halobacteriovoraceae bacterium]|nr:pyridoxamine 5'-phosphate oxidase [Halobacteriovoraceae bacterium]|tara:strand:+ start:73 stop:657 length:585 start_codon:yes stop_codon:yes gene_type:complete